MNYPLIKKWLGLFLHEYPEGFYVKADALEAKLAEGFEVYRDELNYWSLDKDWQVALAIGKQPIKKKTKEEAALEFIAKFVEQKTTWHSQKAWEDAKEILEME